MDLKSPYHISLERAAELACVVTETLEKHPGAKVAYNDDKYESDVLNGLDQLEREISKK